LVSGVDENGDDGSENLLLHGLEVGVLGHNDRGLHEVAHAVITSTTAEYLCIGAALGVLDVTFDVVKGAPVDDGAHEVCWVTGSPHFQCRNLGDQLLLNFRPQVVGQVHAAGCTALLSLEFK